MEQDLAVRVRALRVALKETQYTFADRVGVTPLTVKRWEKGSSVPYPRHLDKMERMAKRAGVTF